MADNYLERRFEEHYKSAPTARTSKQPPIKVRCIYVTGGANGIGQAIVRSLRVAGHKVAFCDIDKSAGEELAAHTGTTFHHLDVRNTDELEASLEQIVKLWGNIDAIVNNVGISHFCPLHQTTVDDFDNTLAINLRPIFVTSRFFACLRHAQASPKPTYGRIVNICSTRWAQSEAGTEAYSASKGAIFSLTHALAVSLSQYGTTVNSISPGWIATRDYDKLSSTDHQQHPSLRVGRPEDIARIVRFLLADENNFINGENITADGGMTHKMIYAE